MTRTATRRPPRYRVTKAHSSAIYSGVHEGIMRLRIRLARDKPSDVDHAISRTVSEIHALVVQSLNASPRATRKQK